MKSNQSDATPTSSPQTSGRLIPFRDSFPKRTTFPRCTRWSTAPPSSSRSPCNDTYTRRLESSPQHQPDRAIFTESGICKTCTDEGRIINILDWRALRPAADHFPYTISKAALAAMTKSLAVALAPRITVNGLALGAILPPSETCG
jgi:NAD(P)-dependent dehydrogenase (short-subunit alcohol dehydrogenase family)